MEQMLRFQKFINLPKKSSLKDKYCMEKRYDHDSFFLEEPIIMDKEITQPYDHVLLLVFWNSKHPQRLVVSLFSMSLPILLSCFSFCPFKDLG